MATTTRRPTTSITKEEEYGYFIRKRYRDGRKRRQKTIRLKKNPEKVILGKLGNLEFYIYPYSFPGKVFIGFFPLSDYIEEQHAEDLLRLYNKVRWYFRNAWSIKPNWRKAANARRCEIQRAYDHGRTAQRSPERA